MTMVVGVRFRRTGKNYYFDPSGFEYKQGDAVVVETSRGIEYADVTLLPREVAEEDIVAPLKPVIRVATEADRQRVRDNMAKEKEAMTIGLECIAARQLEMKLVDVEYTFDGKKIIFYFTADGRVDFRELVRDLAARFHIRIELRQIGVRDETKMMGGLGPCGRAVCCASFLNDFVPVSIRMAKDQNISLNPSKISGLCGRLMCCLQFEHEFYAQEKAKSPKAGADVITPDGPGEMVEHFILREKFRIRVTLPDLSFDIREYPCEEVRIVTPEERQAAVAEIEAKVGKTLLEVTADAESRADRARELRAAHQARARAPRPRPVNENKAQSINDISIFPEEPSKGERPMRDSQEGESRRSRVPRHHGSGDGEGAPRRKSHRPRGGKRDHTEAAPPSSPQD